MASNSLSNSRKRPYISAVILRCVILALFALSALLLTNRHAFRRFAIPYYNGTTNYAETSWTFQQGDTILHYDFELPSYRNLKKDQVYSLSTTLTYDGTRDTNPYGFYFVDHMYTRVLLNEEVLFSYFPEDIEKWDLSRSPGNVYVSFPLPANCQGQKLTIEFIPALSNSTEFGLPNPRFGDYGSTIVRTFWVELPHNLIMTIIGFCGLFTILFSSFTLTGSAYRESLFMGIFATLFCLYNLTESNFDFYAIANPYYTYILDYTAFTLMPIFLMAFLRERLEDRQKKPILVLIIIGILLFVTEMCFHFFGIMDMREFLPILHIGYFSDIVIMLILIATMTRNRKKRSLVWQLIPILIGASLDLAVYYLHWNLDSSDSTFTSLGVLVFLIAEVCHAWKYSVEVYVESIKSRNYERMAYKDPLTGIGNRRAFEAARGNILQHRKPFQSLIVVSADINKLKTINDTYGHIAGDKIIQKAALVLSTFAQGCGHAYRIGGDEFAVLLYDIDEVELDGRLDAMRQQVIALNDQCEPKLSFAYGYEITYGENIAETFETADREMYLQKEKNRTAAPNA